MKRPQTRLLALLLALAVLLSMTACGAADVSAPAEENPTIRVPEPESFGKCTELGTPLADVRVRQALACAIDVDTLIEALCGGRGESAASCGYDPERAKELLAEAGWPSDYVLDVVYTGDDLQTLDMLNVIVSYWAAVGVKAELRRTETGSAEGWDLAFWQGAALTEAALYGQFASSAPGNSHTPEMEGLDELIEQRDMDGVRKILTENVSYIPLLQHDGFVCISSHLDTGGTAFGNDCWAWNKDILNWTTDREDKTLYTDGGPAEVFAVPVAEPGNFYQELVFDRLVDADSSLEPAEGRIAEQYDLSWNGLTLEFILREDLTWHDGEPLTAEDVKFTFELYMLCFDTDPVLTGVLEKLVGAEKFRSGDADGCAGIMAEENKVTFRFTEPVEDALTVFSQWPILPEHKLGNVRPDKLQQHKFWNNPIGSGPYKVAEVDPGKSCILERWDGYWQSGEGNIDRICLTSGEDRTVLAAMDLLDYGWGTSADEAAYIESLDDMKLVPVEDAVTAWFFINQYPHASFHAQEESAEPTE